MKPIWQGTLSFGLVTIPVSLFSAIQSHSLGFTLLCGVCHTPITYKKWCNHCNKEVEWNSIVKGIKIKKDTYFILTQENLHKLKPIKTEEIDIIECIDPALISPIYLENHYYLAPKKRNEKAFFLFARALNETQKVAIGHFVMKDKEHVCVILPYENGLLLTTLNYAYEIKDIESLETLKSIPKLSTQEIDLAKAIINQLNKKKFDISVFKDTFAEKLVAALKKRKKSKLLIAQEKKSKKIGSETDLISSLKASLTKPKVKKSSSKIKQKR